MKAQIEWKVVLKRHSVTGVFGAMRQAKPRQINPGPLYSRESGTSYFPRLRSHGGAMEHKTNVT